MSTTANGIRPPIIVEPVARGPQRRRAVFADGNPTVHSVPAVYPPVITGFDQIEAGVLSANALEAAGVRVVAVGIGDTADISPRNLRGVSGPIEGSDYAVTSRATPPTSRTPR